MKHIFGCTFGCYEFVEGMGMASMSSPSESFRLCVFDLRRGQTEGQELDKILFFYPPDLLFSSQLSVIGLSEGLITFTRLFSPEAACEVIEAEKHSHVFYEAEPDIWMVMVVEKNKDTEAIWRVDALRKVLKEMHSLFLMFHGPVRALLEKEPTGGVTRSQLNPFIMDYLSDLFAGKTLHLPSFRESLKERGTVQMLTIRRDVALEVQSLVGVLESCAGTVRCQSLILFQDLLVSTSLSADDTVSIFTYSVMRLTAHALSSGSSSWSYLRKGSGSSQAISGPVNSSDTMPSGNGNSTHRVIRPLQKDKWSKGKDSFLVTEIWGTETVGSQNCPVPTIWLHQNQQRVYLLPYQYKSLTLVLLVPTTSISDGEQGILAVKQQIVENASLKILKVEEKLSKGWGGENAYHVSGYRYLLVDNDMEVSRASPSGKVATLAKESLLALNKLREEVDSEKSRAKQDKERPEKDMEICIRAKNNAWVIARLTRGKVVFLDHFFPLFYIIFVHIKIFTIIKKENEVNLTKYGDWPLERFSNRYCSGTFSMD
ncbi:PREDICTED: vacuolar fusion protein CCZ1 homolog [Tarenaya hassleriana]|uniref:vacuolar fusion protein CCZ1 homolog n=1 Tax=Tarenaya hassleriana TaxID=28532 RepID=UPI00053C6285|nr:PREDICTED: vacuolar fusion protein CCZ1 homolog [Tarenaya hassleriana]